MSEETEKSNESTEQDLAKEALETTEETTKETSPAGESEDQQGQQGVPIAKHTALRQRAQAAEIKAANLQGQLTTMQQQQAVQAPAPKSPMDLEIERQVAEGIDEEDMTITPRIYREQKLYEQQIANQTAQAESNRQLGTMQLASATKAKAGHEDWQEVVLAGEALLSQGELLDIAAAGDNFGELAYTKCKAVLERNKSKTDTSAAPEKKPSEQEVKDKKEAEEKLKAEKEPPSQSDVLANASAATARAFNI